MDEKRERRLRRKAIRMTLQGVRPKRILENLSRSRRWLTKWRTRYEQQGSAGLRSQSRRPHHTPSQVPGRVRRWVEQARRRLVKRKVGLVGAPSIQRELRTNRLVRQVPSVATIKRILRAARLSARSKPPRAVYYPQPTATVTYVLHAMDWTERYLTGGAKVYAFHTLDLQTRACAQTISTNKSYATVRAHALKTWKTLGIPDGLQMDNDGAFCGGYKAPRIFGQFVRLCLYLGIEPIFIPFGEPERNGDVESVNGLWGSAFWKRRHFRSVAQVIRASPEFEAWYTQHYAPPKLDGRTPAQAHRQARRRRLTTRQMRALPKTLPISEGRLHFLRLVSAEGTIVILNETWHVHKRLAGQYVWATLWTHRRRLEIYHRRSLQVKARLVKTYRYAMPEPVVPVRPEFKHRRRRRKMGTML
jgi:transposase